jgi:hypothetical protein
MKLLFGITLTLCLVVLASQIWAKNLSAKIEMYPYEVIKGYKDFEIRRYASANFSYVQLESNTYEQSSSNGFRQLAGYIFGGNERGQEIAMTSPVEMEMDIKMTMKFLIPKEHDIADLPKPDNENVKFKREPERIVAAIRFSGYANDAKIAYYKKALKKILQIQGLQHNGEFSFLGYNSPFDFFNRRNEVIVELSNL